MALGTDFWWELSDAELISFTGEHNSARFAGVSVQQSGNGTTPAVQAYSTNGPTGVRVGSTAAGAGGSNLSGILIPIGRIAEGQTNSGGGYDTAFGEIVASFRGKWDRGAGSSHWGTATQFVTLLQFLNASNGEVAGIGVGARNTTDPTVGHTIKNYTGGESSGEVTRSATEFTPGTEYQWTIRYKKSTGSSDGILQIWLDDTLLSDASVTDHNNTDDVAYIRVAHFPNGTIAAGTPTRYPMTNDVAGVGACTGSKFADIYSSTPSNMHKANPLGALAWGQVGTDFAYVGTAAPQSAWRHAWAASSLQARIDYGTDSGLSGSSQTSWSDIAAAAKGWKAIKLTSLTADTTYYYRVQVTSDGGTTVESSPIRSFKTLPADNEILVGHITCTDQGLGPSIHAYDHYLNAGVDFAVHHGDFVYQDSGGTSNGYCVTVEEMVREMRLAMTDQAFLRLAHARHILAFASDHDFWHNEVNQTAHDNADSYAELTGSWYQGYVVSSTYDPGDLNSDNDGSNASLYDDASAIVPDTNYRASGTDHSADIPVSQLYDEGREARWWTMAQFTDSVNMAATPSASPWVDTEHCFSWRAGDIRFIRAEDRSYQDFDGDEPFSDGSPSMLGGHIKKWLKLQIDGLTDEKLVVLLCDGVMGDIQSGSDDYEGNFNDERQELIDYFNANAPAGCRFVIIAGDRHCEFAHKRFTSAYNATLTNPTTNIIGEVGVGAGAKSVFTGYTEADATRGGVLYSSAHGLNPSASPTPWIRSGTRITYRANGITARFADDDDTQLSLASLVHDAGTGGTLPPPILDELE